MSIKAKIEAIIYAAEEPVTLEQIVSLVREEAREELIQARAAAAAAPEAEEGSATEETQPAASFDQQPPVDTVGMPAEDAEPEPQPATEGVSPAETAAGNEVEAEAPPGTDPVLDPTPDPDSAASAPEAPAETAADQSQSSGQEIAPSKHEAPISEAEIKSAVRAAIAELMAGYSTAEHGIEVRQIAGGYRMATKPEHHDAVRGFAKSLKPPIRLSLQALETLAVIAYKQPVTAPEIGEIRGVDSGGVLGTLLDRKLITTGGRKQVIGRPILYKTTKEFLLRFGLKGLEELPSMEEFEKLAAESFGADLFAAPAQENAPGPDASTAAIAAEDSGAAEADAVADSSVPSPSETEDRQAEIIDAAGDSSVPARPETEGEV